MESSKNILPASDLGVFEATPGLSIVSLPDSPVYTILAVSNELVQATGLQRKDIIGKGFFEFVKHLKDPHHTGEQNLHTSIGYVLKNKRPHEIPIQRYDIPANDGSYSYKYWNIKTAPVLTAEGNVAYIILSLFDVTNTIRDEDHLESIKGVEKAYKFFMNAPVIIGYIHGPDYIIEFANEGLLKVWGRSKDVIGKPLLSIVPELEMQGTKQLLDEVRTTGKPFFAYKHPLVFNRNGVEETLYFDFVYQPFYESDDEKIVSGIISVGHDVTEQIRVSEMEQSLEALKYENQNLEEFAYAASHDLQEPVRKILFFSNLLKGELKDKLENKQIELFERLEKSSARMQNLIDDLLEYSQAAKGTSEQEELDLNSKIKGVLEDLELEVKAKQATIRYNSLPTLRGNKRQMQQLFQNLLSNALKYSQPGVPTNINITSKIVLGNEAKDDLPIEAREKYYHLIEVADNGIGFEQKDADRIFKAFMRLHSSSHYKGTGVGLSIVRKVVESHNGFVWGESNLGKGAVFKILLPVHES